MPFEQLLQKILAKAGEDLPDYLLRMCLRFWISTDPPLVEKVRTRYRPIRPARFAQAARRAWQQLGDNAG